MKQDSRWSSEQLTILKGALAENTTLLSAIRKVFLEDKLSANEKKALETGIRGNEAIQEVITRHYCPELVVDAPIGQVQDRLTSLGLDAFTPDVAVMHADSVERTEKCLKEHLNELFTGEKATSYQELYKLDKDDVEETYTGLLARNRYISDCERLTYHLHLLAGRKDETAEETMERLRKDSAR